MSGTGIRWAICKCASRSRQITTPAPYHSDFYRPDALPATQPTASKHWRQCERNKSDDNKLAMVNGCTKVTMPATWWSPEFGTKFQSEVLYMQISLQCSVGFLKEAPMPKTSSICLAILIQHSLVTHSHMHRHTRICICIGILPCICIGTLP